MDPFVWDKDTVLRTRNPNAAINIVIRNSNTTIYGLNTMEITQIKYEEVYNYCRPFHEFLEEL